MAKYTVRYGETIGDAVINSTGIIGNWAAILQANSYDTWTPELTPGDVLLIPDDLPVNNDAMAQLVKYPSNNQSVSDVYAKITVIFTTLAAAEPATAPVIPAPVKDTNIYYKVRYGETIGDVVLNATGNMANWSDILDANGYNDWTPQLAAGQIMIIPASVVTDPNTMRALQKYPANNESVPDVYDKINSIFGIMNPNDWILKTSFWNDGDYWRDKSSWID